MLVIPSNVLQHFSEAALCATQNTRLVYFCHKPCSSCTARQEEVEQHHITSMSEPVAPVQKSTGWRILAMGHEFFILETEKHKVLWHHRPSPHKRPTIEQSRNKQNRPSQKKKPKKKGKTTKTSQQNRVDITLCFWNALGGVRSRTEDGTKPRCRHSVTELCPRVRLCPLFISNTWQCPSHHTWFCVPWRKHVSLPWFVVACGQEPETKFWGGIVGKAAVVWPDHHLTFWSWHNATFGRNWILLTLRISWPQWRMVVVNQLWSKTISTLVMVIRL